MSHPCQYNVYKRERGARRQGMMAKFLTQTDAVNYAHSLSTGRYARCGTRIYVTHVIDGTLFIFRDGERLK